MALLKNKKNVLILASLLFFLILPRLAVYFIFGEGFSGTDAQFRYFPQAEKLSESFSNFFSQTGPFYSLFLLFFKKINNDMIAGPVLVQHAVGVITAVLAFYYFRRVNLLLAGFVSIFVYSGWLALWLEHTILRESLTAFFLILLVLIFSAALKDEKYFKPSYAFLAGLLALILFFLRMEFLVLAIFFPLVFFFAKKGNPPAIKFWDRRFLGWGAAYFLPLLVFFLASAVFLKKQEKNELQYGSLFGISYYSLAYNDFMPRIFYYKGSRYPGLVEKYQSALETRKDELNNLDLSNKREKTSRTMAIVTEATQDYLSLHPEINLSANRLMDKLYFEIIRKNTLIYLEGVAVNFKNHLMGTAELDTASAKDGQISLLKTHLSGNEPSGVKEPGPVSLLDRAFRAYVASLIIFSKALFWLFLISLPLLFFKWRTMPVEVAISFFVGFLHLFVLAIFADPAHRFRYPVDPFLYFFQLYSILFFFKTLSSRNRVFQEKTA